jgi:hypothetical protein
MKFKSHTIELSQPITMRVHPSDVIDSLEKETTKKLNKMLESNHESFYVTNGVLYGYTDWGDNRGGSDRVPIEAPRAARAKTKFNAFVAVIQAVHTLQEHSEIFE